MGLDAIAAEVLDGLRDTVATACRVLADEGLVQGVLGHVSARVDETTMLVRSRGPAERGLLFSTPRDVRLADLDGRLLDDGDDGGYQVPNEVFIHAELLRRRPDVNAVVHAHPVAPLLCGIGGIPLVPAFGAFNIPAMRMALDSIPVYPRAVLIRRPELAAEMVAAMGSSSVCVLRGHGITTTGATVEEAVVRALNLNALAEVAVELARMGVNASPIDDRDVAELPDLGSAFNDLSVWRYHVAKAALRGGTGSWAPTGSPDTGPAGS